MKILDIRLFMDKIVLLSYYLSPLVYCIFAYSGNFSLHLQKVLKRTAKKKYIASYQKILKLKTLVQCPDLAIHW